MSHAALTCSYSYVYLSLVLRNYYYLEWYERLEKEEGDRVPKVIFSTRRWKRFGIGDDQ